MKLTSITQWCKPKKEPSQHIQQWQEQHTITHDTARMLNGVMHVANQHVRDIMVPKEMMCALDLSDPIETTLATIIETGHSRFPLLDPQQEQAIGIIMAKDILKHQIHGDSSELDLKAIARPIKIIPESKRLNLLLREFRLSHKHMAMVVDEYGALSGLVTIEDVLEQIVGDIIDEFDVNESLTIEKIAHQQYEMSSMTPIETCNQMLGTHFSDRAFETIGGIVMHHFGRIPKKHEVIDIDGHSIKVVNADHRHIKQIIITLSDHDAKDASSA